MQRPADARVNDSAAIVRGRFVARDPREERAEVHRNLLRRPPRIDCRYFYDDLGSDLFEQITEQPEYYPMREEGKLHTQGVMIESIRTGSFADLQGLEPGLVITKVNRQPTASQEQFDAIVSKLKTGDDVVFEVLDPNHPEMGINYIGGTLQ